MRVRRETGTIMAPPMPCTTRAATSCGRETDMAQSTEPTVNSVTAERKVRRVPKVSASQPLRGMSRATVSV